MNTSPIELEFGLGFVLIGENSHNDNPYNCPKVSMMHTGSLGRANQTSTRVVHWVEGSAYLSMER